MDIAGANLEVRTEQDGVRADRAIARQQLSRKGSFTPWRRMFLVRGLSQRP